MNQLLVLDVLRRREYERRRELRLQRRQLRDASNPFQLPEVRFVELFRFPQFWVPNLIGILEPYLDNGTRTTAIPYHQRSVGMDYHLGMSQTVISRCVTLVTAKIEQHLLPLWIKFPTTNEEVTRINQTFMLKRRVPGVIGAIDCTHVKI